MKTYQDLIEAPDKSKFILEAIHDYQDSDMYKTAKLGDEYNKQHNRTIMLYDKYLYTVSGNKILDTYSANHKLASNFYHRLNVQETQYLLGNGVNFNDEKTKEALQTKRCQFDTQLQKLGMKALTHRVSYGFYNKDHIEIFTALNFVPLMDEEDGLIKSGIRFWQVDRNKPLRCTLYELDGYTEYIKRPNNELLEVYKPKRAYILHISKNEVGDEEVIGENYSAFPIVPLWANEDHICYIEAWHRKIDCYDLIESGFANDIDDACVIYWAIQNAGGMDDVDLAEFIQRMKTIHAAKVDDEGANAVPHTIDVPVNARQTYLDMLERDIIKDAMALDTTLIASGNTVATAIKAAYEALNNKTDEFEYCVREFIQHILELAGIDDDPTFKRSTLINQTEETNMVLSAAQYLDTETILKHLPFISNDEIENILTTKQNDEMARYELDQESVDETKVDAEEVVEDAEEVTGKALNGIQTQNLMAVISQYSSGVINENQAVNIIAATIGISKDKAREIVLGN